MGHLTAEAGSLKRAAASDIVANQQRVEALRWCGCSSPVQIIGLVDISLCAWRLHESSVQRVLQFASYLQILYVDSVVLYCIVVPCSGLDWIGHRWTGLDRLAGVDWTGLGWAAPGWIGPAGLVWAGLDRT